MKFKDISSSVIKRLPRYYRYLGELYDEGVQRISSGELSRRMRVTASQIRQDLNHFGGFGLQGYGYNVKYLRDEIGKILKLDKQHTVIILGAGNLGRTLANYNGYLNSSFKIVGLFDKRPSLKGTKVNRIPVRMISELPEFLENYPTDIAILALPTDDAGKAAEVVVQNGIKAILNFSHVDLDVPEDVVVENVHLQESLMTLVYKMEQQNNQNSGTEQ